jgi:ABC-type bacteriocin/lantibiotic exporter with double-glycine peptidase domain
MKSTLFVPIAKRLSTLVSHGYKLFNLTDEYHNNIDYKEDIHGFIDGLTDKSQRIDLALLKHDVRKEDLITRVEASQYPLMSFVRAGWDVAPVIFFVDTRRELNAYLYQDDEETHHSDPQLLLDNIVENEQGFVTTLMPLPMHSMLSSDDGNLIDEVKTPVSRLFKLLKAEKKDIFYIYFYSALIALIGLTLPVGVQAIMELISGGVFFTSIILLIGVVVVGVVISGILQLMQISLVEVLERRVFVRSAFELSFRVPQMKAEAILNNYAPELMNRFFDVLTLQKGLPKLLIDVTSSILQILFGLILISFYHPLFIFFGLALLATLAIIF